MVICKNWSKIAELDYDRNFLKLYLLVEDGQEKLAEVKKLYPKLFCGKSVNLCISKSLIIKESINYCLEFDEAEGMKDDPDAVKGYGERCWQMGCIKLGVPIVYLSKFQFNFLPGVSDVLEKIETGEEDFRAGYKIKIFGKEMIIVDYDPIFGGEYSYILALAEHIDMNS